MTFSPDAEAIRARLLVEGINNFWHFTPITNVKTIKGRGLYSKARLEREGLFDNVVTGGTPESVRYDRERGNWDYVSLAYTHSTPMFWHRKKDLHLIYCEVSPEVACLENVLFTNKNALKQNNGTTRQSGLTGLQEVQFQYFKPGRHPTVEWREFVQAEVLVPDCVERNYISRVYTVSPLSKLYAELILGKPSTRVIVRPDLFQDNLGGQFSFPFLHSIRLFDLDTLAPIEGLNKDVFDWDTPEGPVWRINQKVFAAFIANASLGTKLSCCLDDKLLSPPRTFNANGRGWITDMLDLEDKQGTLQVFLNDICWFQCEVR